MTRRYRLVIAFSLVACFAGTAHAQDQATLTPVKDNTIYEESGNIRSGVGPFVFVGRTSGGQGTLSRRALIAFDVAASVPEEARVDSVELQLHVSNVSPGGAETDVDVHRLTAEWGEASSDAGNPGGQGADAEQGDATWTHALYDSQTWASEGGDFVAESSATFTVAGQGTNPVVSTEGLAADVQAWLDDPESNFGWILIGDEENTQTARRLNSRENQNQETWPRLTVYYSTGTAAEQPDLPGAFVLEGNYPNPFAESTVIRYELERTQEVGLEVYDVTGRPVRTVQKRAQPPGPHEIELDAADLASGLYIYCLSTSSGRECRTLTVLR